MRSGVIFALISCIGLGIVGIVDKVGTVQSQSPFVFSSQSILFSLTTFKDIVEQAQKMDYINKEEMQTILDWTSDPITWGKRMGFE